MKKLTTLSMLILLISIKLSFSQKVEQWLISPCGGVFTQGQTSIQFALGEVITETISSADNILTQGFVQPYYNFTDLSVKDLSKTNFDIKIYPNPVLKELWINPVNIEISQYEILNISGKIVQQNILVANKIDFESLNCGIYLLKLYSKDQQIVKTVKIVKM